MTRRSRRALVSAAAVMAVFSLVVISGVVPLEASSGHWPPVARLLDFAFERSVTTYSSGIEAKSVDDPRLVQVGAGHYEGGCRFCHGAPGRRRPRIPLRMLPSPPALAKHTPAYDDAELFYIVRHGVKFTGMPAWPAEEREDEVWAVVAFLRVLPRLDGPGYDRLVYGIEAARSDSIESSRAPEVVTRQCARCHGLDGLGREEHAFPSLAGQRFEYLRASMVAYAEGQRHSGIMGPIAANLAPLEMRAAARWYAALRAPAGRGSTDPLGRSIVEFGIPERRVPPCGPCHGPRPKRHRAFYPRLAAQHAHYLEQQLRLFTARARGGTEYAELMRVVTEHALEPNEVAAVARHYAALPGDGAGAE